MNYISFPGLGLDYFKLNPVAFTIFGHEIRWYGIIICIGIILGFIVILNHAKKKGISTDDILDMAIIVIPTAIIGARLYYVLTSLESYHSFYEVIAIWEGGLAIYGAVIFGAIAAIIVCKYKKINVLSTLDCIAPGVMLGQLIGRWGNFVNAEAFGSIEQYDFFGFIFKTPNLAETYPLRMLIKYAENSTYTIVAHPTFLYESIWNFIGFILISLYFKHRKFNGEILLMYLAWYGFGRCIIEGFRTDSLWIGQFRISQLIAGLCFVVGIVLIIVFNIKAKFNKSNLDDYTPVFANAQTDDSNELSEKTKEKEE